MTIITMIVSNCLLDLAWLGAASWPGMACLASLASLAWLVLACLASWLAGLAAGIWGPWAYFKI